MFAFYFWIICDFISNMLWLVLAIRSNDNPMPLIIYFPATFKVLVGTEQIWLMVELIV